ncbi:hypothetical protein Q3V23_07090 [Streptomyces sp. VNUA116]|uniref:hypothetical protein n=1 Tax=Streptomyces sp. VNUA116 TaxID=3062449 RepID=UPI002675FCCC|nr:hypothetical protein [Streptomyces sp. VNUA116]WKU43870.1 hypothetical protein Q3V23_07090 [Streptomyces sp. VNUA116]
MPSDVLRADDADAFTTALASGSATVFFASQSTINTGSVTGGQSQITSGSSADAPTGTPRQGPVRPKDLKTARRCFVPPPAFEGALAALDSGVSLLVGAPGTGRETCALNLLAHGREEPVLVQLDGAVDLSRWVPRPQGVHGYLLAEPPDPFAVRSWDLSRLEASLAEVGARLLIVLADAPGLATALEDHLGTPVVRHVPPDPRKVFAAHLAEACPVEDARTRLLRSLGPGALEELLPAELPPRHAAQTAEAVTRLGGNGGSSATELMRALARAEAPELVARAQEDPVLFSHLLSLSVYGGLDRSVVVERAADLLRLTASQGEQEPVVHSPLPHLNRQQAGASRQRSLTEILRALEAHCSQRTGIGETDVTDTVSFFWPAVGDAVWEILCRDHTDLLPLLHAWLGGTGREPDQIERAGKSVAAVAVLTGGRTLQLLRHLVSVPWPPAVEVVGWCLGTVAADPAAGAKAEALLDEWSIAPEAALRKAVAYACRPDRGRFTVDQALRLLHRLMETVSNDADDVAVAVAEALVQRFAAGDCRARETVLGRMRDWAAHEGVPDQLTALTFPLMVGTDLAWCGSRLLANSETALDIVRLTGHSLTASTTYPSMRDVLLEWCCRGDGGPQSNPALERLLRGLVEAREPGFLRWLMAVERGPETMPGKALAAQLMTLWHSKSAARNANDGSS